LISHYSLRSLWAMREKKEFHAEHAKSAEILNITHRINYIVLWLHKSRLFVEMSIPRIIKPHRGDLLKRQDTPTELESIILPVSTNRLLRWSILI
jgi:hypothetical protein